MRTVFLLDSSTVLNNIFVTGIFFFRGEYLGEVKSSLCGMVLYDTRMQSFACCFGAGTAHHFNFYRFATGKIFEEQKFVYEGHRHS